MLVLVITTLVIGLLGVYAQVLALQAAQFAAAQNGLAIMMMTWHAAAVSMGASVVDTLPSATLAASLPCSLTDTMAAGSFANAWPPAGVPLCPSPLNPPQTGVAIEAKGTVTIGGVRNKIFNVKITPAPGAIELVHLPPNYMTGLYQFYSVLYLDPTSAQPYVVTFMQPPANLTGNPASNPAPGYLAFPPNATSPTNSLSSFTMSDLIHQLQVSGLQPYTYGTVTNVGATSTLNTSGLTFNMPVLGGVAVLANGATAIVTSPAGY